MIIATSTDLKAACAALDSTPWLGLDTEFMRERTYHPQLCLLQLASDEQLLCIDPIALSDLTPLRALLQHKLCILHAADQDLAVLHSALGWLPKQIFDTQLAAAILGLGEQLGYAPLVEKRLGHHLDKSQTRTDWSRRPLSEAQIRYALDDVRHLGALYQDLSKALRHCDRLHWLDDDFADLCRPGLYQVQPENAWQRVRATRQLSRTQLRTLQRLAAWRENTALQCNVPRRWVVGDDLLIALARRRPTQPEAIRRLNEWKSTYAGHLDALLTCLKAPTNDDSALAQPMGDIDEHQKALCSAVLQACALHHGLSPSFIGNTRDIEALLSGRASRLQRGWRRYVAGEAITEFLAGRLSIGLEDGVPQLRELKAC